ncbi:MAG TPA: glycosyltransferase family A protein [Ignavibacteria bacterium]|nr:glycosyltransferase family A protein [Ignavibacteria bacterium]
METEINNYDVSVILTLFNSRQTFRRALESVLKQTYKNFELIIVDDGSTDDIENELFPLLKENPAFKYIRHSNRKHPLSLNTGIMNSSGKYISFLDSDDEYGPEYIKARVHFLESHIYADLLYSPATLIGNEEDMFVPDAKDNSKLVHLNDCIIGGTFFGKRNVFFDMNGFRNIYSHDSDFYQRAYEKFKIVRFDNSDYVYYRNNPDSVISKLKKETSI